MSNTVFMVEFKKEVGTILPYDREEYFNFLDEDYEGLFKWFGVSFQLPNQGKEISAIEFIDNYETLFTDVISQLDQNTFWIVNHDDKDMSWFPNEEDNLISLRTLFNKEQISNSYKGALILKKDDLLKFSKDLISYPMAVFNEERLLYKNLDISHDVLPFIIKISGHGNIDFLSTDKAVLKKIIDKNHSSHFEIKYYRGVHI